MLFLYSLNNNKKRRRVVDAKVFQYSVCMYKTETSNQERSLVWKKKTPPRGDLTFVPRATLLQYDLLYTSAAGPVPSHFLFPVISTNETFKICREDA